MTKTADEVPASQTGLERSIPHGGASGRVARGLGWTVGGEWASYLVQISTTMVLARLLSPEIFGVMAMAMTLTVLVDQFRSLGLSQAVVQRENLTWAQVNALFWVNAGAGVVLAAVVALTGPLVAAFYGEPEVAGVCAALGAGYVLSGVAVQHGALLNRHMRFRTIAGRNFASRVGSSVAAIVAAVAGLGVWALVIQQLAAVLIATILTWAAVRWHPSRPSGIAEALPLIRFGGQVTVSNLLNTISRQADNIIIGRLLGAASLGLYTRAYSLMTLPLRQLRTPLSAVMVPTLSALQDQPERYRTGYRRAVSGLAHIGFPVVAVLAASATEVIDVFLGPAWVEAVPIFQWLVIAGVVQLIATTCGWLFVSFGHGRRLLVWSVFSSAVTVAFLFAGAQWGATGVAAAYAVSQLVLAGPVFAVATRDTPVRFVDPLRAVFRPLVVSAATLAVALGITAELPQTWPSVFRLAVIVGGAVITWSLIIFAWRDVREELLTLVRAFRRRRR